MSSKLGGLVLSVYGSSPKIAAAATVGAMISVASGWASNGWASKRVSLPSPTTTFNFIVTTCVAIPALEKSLSFISEKSSASNFGTITRGGSIVCSALYGLHITSNPQRTFTEFAQLGVLTLGSVVGVIGTTGSMWKSLDKKHQLPLDEMTDSLLINSAKTAAAAGSAWVVSHLIGLNPQVTLLFTATMSALYYTTKPLFEDLELRLSKNNYARRALSLLYLAKFTADRLEIQPLQTSAKTCAVAGVLIALFDKANRPAGRPPDRPSRRPPGQGGYDIGGASGGVGGGGGSDALGGSGSGRYGGGESLLLPVGDGGRGSQSDTPIAVRSRSGLFTTRQDPAGSHYPSGGGGGGARRYDRGHAASGHVEEEETIDSQSDSGGGAHWGTAAAAAARAEANPRHYTPSDDDSDWYKG